MKKLSLSPYFFVKPSGPRLKAETLAVDRSLLPPAAGTVLVISLSISRVSLFPFEKDNGTSINDRVSFPPLILDVLTVSASLAD